MLEEVIVELLKMKCLSVLFHGLESCPLNEAQIKSLDFAINSAFSKIFCTKSHDIIDNSVGCYLAVSLFVNSATNECGKLHAAIALCILMLIS